MTGRFITWDFNLRAVQMVPIVEAAIVSAPIAYTLPDKFLRLINIDIYIDIMHLRFKYSLNVHRPCSSQRKQRKTFPIPRAVPPSDLLSPGFLDAYVTLVCNPKAPCEPILPEYYSQVAILHKFNLIAMQNNIEGFERQVFRLLLLHDSETLAVLLENIKSYQMATHNINIISSLVGLSPSSS